MNEGNPTDGLPSPEDTERNPEAAVDAVGAPTTAGEPGKADPPVPDGGGAVHDAVAPGTADAAEAGGRGPEGATRDAAAPVPDARSADAVPRGAAEPGGGDFELALPVAGPVSDDLPAGPAVGERTRPLHDPDPYGTPPYGRPGPWAPAPPVQHPAAAPAGDTDAPPPQPPRPTAPVPPQKAAPAPAPDPTTDEPTPTVPPADADPWGRYDPWGASGALQRTGAVGPGLGGRRRRGWKAVVGGVLVVAVVSGVGGGFVGSYLERNGGVGTVELPQAGKEPSGRPADSVAGIAARALPSVVTLHVTGRREQGTGTGFVLDTRGHILTNNHVVEPAGPGGDITITFSGGDTAPAEVVGRDSGYDLAVVRVKGVRGLTPLPLGNSDNVQVGDPVVAIGAPFDLANTVTSGIISAKERPITSGGDNNGSDVSYVDALQTDAPINPGNSGGPLLDARARVVGVNSAIRSADDAAETEGGQAGSIGLGFAIPVNQAKRVAEELINDGRATHPVIGVTLDMNYDGDGARIGSRGGDGGPAVTVGGPGDRAGLKSGDVITEVDGRRVHSGEELIVRTRAHRPGDRLGLTVERAGHERRVSLVLGSSDQN
ncbi:trypsin-like peptidase domain-containing protein [Streptomyces sp. NPDC026672]|uniref:S1C family serine protease n=1 Tax=unclassified Streptomyces TaxID=2593676 RepID=UPI0033DE44F5